MYGMEEWVKNIWNANIDPWVEKYPFGFLQAGCVIAVFGSFCSFSCF